VQRGRLVVQPGAGATPRGLERRVRAGPRRAGGAARAGRHADGARGGRAGAAGCSRLSLAGGMEVMVVEDAAQLPAALAALRASMEDPLVAIDLVSATRMRGGCL